MKTYTVSVTVGQGSISVQPDRQVMTTDDEVQWASSNGKRFTIEFEGAGPFPNARLAFAAATAKQRPRTKGRFKYTVISEENPTLTLDPEVVVDPPPTGP